MPQLATARWADCSVQCSVLKGMTELIWRMSPARVHEASNEDRTLQEDYGSQHKLLLRLALERLHGGCFQVMFHRTTRKDDCSGRRFQALI